MDRGSLHQPLQPPPVLRGAPPPRLPALWQHLRSLQPARPRNPSIQRRFLLPRCRTTLRTPLPPARLSPARCCRRSLLPRRTRPRLLPMHPRSVLPRRLLPILCLPARPRKQNTPVRPSPGSIPMPAALRLRSSCSCVSCLSPSLS